MARSAQPGGGATCGAAIALGRLGTGFHSAGTSQLHPPQMRDTNVARKVGLIFSRLTETQFLTRAIVDHYLAHDGHHLDGHDPAGHNRRGGGRHHDVYHCTLLCTTVHHRAPCTTAHYALCAMHRAPCATVHYAPLVHHCAPLCTTTHHYAPLCTAHYAPLSTVHHCVPLCTVHCALCAVHYAPLCSMHHCALCTMHHCALCTTVYHCAPLCTMHCALCAVRHAPLCTMHHYALPCTTSRMWIHGRQFKGDARIREGPEHSLRQGRGKKMGQ